MSYRRTSYDPVKWGVADPERRPRRASTRWFLLPTLALALAMPVIAMLDGPDTDGIVSMSGYLPLIFVFCWSPFGRDSVFLSKRLASFDEFERYALARATRRSYATLLLLMLAGTGWMWFASPRGLPVPTSSQDWSACAFTLLFAGIALPVAFAEWMVPLPPVLDEMED